MGWKTILGGFIGVVGWALGQPELDIQVIVTAIGGLLGVVGVRDAIRKGPQKPGF